MNLSAIVRHAARGPPHQSPIRTATNTQQVALRVGRSCQPPLSHGPLRPGKSATARTRSTT